MQHFEDTGVTLSSRLLEWLINQTGSIYRFWNK